MRMFWIATEMLEATLLLLKELAKLEAPEGFGAQEED